MKTVLYLGLLACCILIAPPVHSQSEYRRCIERGDRALRKDPPAFDEAINWYFIARWTPNVTIDETAEVDQRIDLTLHKWVDTLRQQRNLADSLRKVEILLRSQAEGRSINSENTLRLLYGYRAADKAGYHLQQKRIHPAFAISYHALKTMIDTQDGTVYDTSTLETRTVKLPIPPSVYLTFGQSVAAKFLDTLPHQHHGGVIASGWSKQGQHLYLVGRDSMVSWYEMVPGVEFGRVTPQQLYPLEHSSAMPGLILAAAMPGSKQLLIGSQDSLWQWEISRQQFLPLAGGDAYVDIQTINEKRFFTISRDGQFIDWDQGLSTVLAEALQAFVALQFSAKKDYILARTMNQVYFGKVDELSTTPLQPLYQSSGLIYWAALMGNGQDVIISTQQEGILAFSDRRTSPSKLYDGPISPSYYFAVAADGNRLLSTTTNGELIIIERNSDSIHIISRQQPLADSFSIGGFDHLTANEEGTLLAASTGEHLFLWQEGKWQPIESQNTNTITTISLSSSANQLLAIGTLDGQLLLWDIDKGFRTLDHQFQQAIMKVFFSMDGQHIYIHDATGTVYTLPVPDLVFDKSKETPIPQLEQIIQELHKEMEDDLRT